MVIVLLTELFYCCTEDSPKRASHIPHPRRKRSDHTFPAWPASVARLV